MEPDEIRAAEVVLPCADIAATVEFFTAELGFRLDAILPADDPRIAQLSGHGVRLCLERGADAAAGRLRLFDTGADARRALTAPNGTRVEVVPAASPPELPALEPALVVARASAARWTEGRAGMSYRDLIPGRQGGRFIASHIRVAAGGPVADSVHHHRVRFQTIYCHRGSVRVVYEDQGAPFVLEPGDCVLQPPGIRHRVLECSPGLEVIELSCPAEHETRFDHELALPTPTPRTEREFDGQRFVRHRAAEAAWTGWRLPGFECRDTGIAAATSGLAAVRIVRPAGAAHRRLAAHSGELLFLFVLRGEVRFARDGDDDIRLATDDALTLPAGVRHAPLEPSGDLELLEIAVPADSGPPAPTI